MVTSKLARRNTTHRVALILVAGLFAGCVSDMSGSDQSMLYMQGVTRANSDYYLQQMRQASNNSRTNWQLLAIRALLQEGRLPQAEQLYQQLPTKLNDAQMAERILSGVQLALAQKNDQQADSLLRTINPERLNAYQQQRYWQAQIDVNQGQPSPELLRALIAQEPLLQGVDKQKNIDATWRILTKMTPEQIDGLVIKADELTLRGWLDLQHAWSACPCDPGVLQSRIHDWQTRYPKNPAATTLPQALSQELKFTTTTTIQKVGLFLPLKQQGAVFGTAIEQGFEMAKNTGTSPVVMPEYSPVVSLPTTQEAQNADDTEDIEAMSSVAQTEQQAVQDVALAATSDIPALQADSLIAGSIVASPDVQLKIYDTSTEPLSSLLIQAQQDGVTMIVGPLLKDNVAALLNDDITLNVLALNHPDHPDNRSNICYYALSPEDEAKDAARRIWQQAYQQPLILVPYGQLGNRISQAFASEWYQSGGGTVLKQTFGSINELKQQINYNRGIRLTGEPMVSGQQRDFSALSTAAIDVEAAQISSSPVDAVYIIATQQELALIKPMIIMNIGSRSPVAFYASSRSSQSGSEVDYRIEMEGLQFSEIPLLAGANPALMQQALSAMNGDYSLVRLYAMGVDAWTLANHFNQLRHDANFIVKGNTGQMHADDHCVIHRKLVWLKYQNGQIVPVQ